MMLRKSRREEDLVLDRLMVLMNHGSVHSACKIYQCIQSEALGYGGCFDFLWELDIRF